MAKQQNFYLDENKTQEVIVSWRGIWKDVTVTLNGEQIGMFPDFRSLKQGNVFHLRDGSTLAVHFSTERYNQGLRIDYNGRPLKGTSGDPETKLKSVFGISIFIGALNLIIGAIGQFGDVEFLEEMGANWILMVIGAVIIGLGYCSWKYRSNAALIAIILLLVADIMLTFYFSLQEGRVSIGGVVLKVFMIIALSQGFGAIRAIKDEELMKARQLGSSPFQ